MLFYILIIILTLIVLMLLAAIYLSLRPMISGAIYFPTFSAGMEAILRFADMPLGSKIVDLGSGDGRILIAFAKKGIEAHGYEINPLLVWRSRLLIKKAGLQNKAFVYWKSLWKAQLSDMDLVVVYGIPYIMNRLEKKLTAELKVDAKIISNAYPFPSWHPQAQEDKIYFYQFNKISS